MHLLPLIDWNERNKPIQWAKERIFRCAESNEKKNYRKTRKKREPNEDRISSLFSVRLHCSSSKKHNDYHLKMLYHHNFMNLNDSVFVFCTVSLCRTIAFAFHWKKLRVIGNILVWYFNCNFKTIKSFVVCCHFYFFLVLLLLLLLLLSSISSSIRLWRVIDFKYA